MKDRKFFESNLWVELNRYDEQGKFFGTVTCTEENLLNLYNSQFKNKTVYGQIFSYEVA